MIKRRKARELALQILFQAEVGNLPIEEAMETTLAEVTDMGEEICDYATQLVRGVWEQKAKLDNQIQSVATNWTVERMAAIDRNLIRMALYEILHIPDVPYRVAINEAVELAKEYGTTESRRFVNGVLGALVRKLGLDKIGQKKQ